MSRYKWNLSALALLILPGMGTMADQQIEEITVYGQNAESLIGKASLSVSKTDTDILALPQSIQVLNRNLLDAQQHQTLSEALGNVSGASSSSLSETLTTHYKLRGFNTYVYYDQLPAFGQAPSSSPESLRAGPIPLNS